MAVKSYTVTDTVTIFDGSNPTYTGRHLTGWKATTVSGSGVTLNTVYNPGAQFSAGTYGEQIFTAQWEINTYTITLKPNGGSISGLTANSGLTVKTANSVLTATYDTEGKFTSTVTRTGYTFTGWTKSGSTGTLTNGTITSGQSQTMNPILLITMTRSPARNWS